MKEYKEKYYVPKIEEFHYGFRCKVRYDYHDKFSKIECGLITNYSEMNNFIKESRVKVKRLDSKDIIELGWAKRQLNMYSFNDKYILNYWIPNLRTGIPLIRIFKAKYDPLSNNYFSDTNNCSFTGMVKNYNEFKKIMQQIEII